MHVGCALLDRPLDHLVDERDRRAAVGGLAHVHDVEATDRARGCAVTGVDFDLDVVVLARRVEALERRVDVRRGGDGELKLEPERDAQVVGGEDVRRVGHRDDDPVSRETDRHRPVAACELLGEERGGSRIGRRRVEVDELELVLLGERLRDLHLRHPAVRDDELTQTLAGASLLREGLVELRLGEQALAHEEIPEAKALPSEGGRGFHAPLVSAVADEA